METPHPCVNGAPAKVAAPNADKKNDAKHANNNNRLRPSPSHPT
jgi:hypothetical protein